jgi:hypothetical protein
MPMCPMLPISLYYPYITYLQKTYFTGCRDRQDRQHRHKTLKNHTQSTLYRLSLSNKIETYINMFKHNYTIMEKKKIKRVLTLHKFGNSYYTNVPKKVREQFNKKKGDDMGIVFEDDS